MKAELEKPKQKAVQKPLGRFRTVQDASNYKVGLLNNIFKNIAFEKFEKLGK